MTNRQTGRQTNGEQTDRQTNDKQTDRQTYRQMTNRQTDRQTNDEETDRQTYRQMTQTNRQRLNMNDLQKPGTKHQVETMMLRTMMMMTEPGWSRTCLQLSLTADD